VGDTLFFFHFVISATDTRDELWTSDGTASGTRLVRDLGQGLIQQPTAAHGQLFFALFPEDADGALWVSDGTASGTRRVRDSGSGPLDLVVAGGDLYYSASDPQHGRELWTSDGTRKGTRLVADLTPGPADSSIHLLSESEDRLYFTLDDPASTGLLLYKVRVDGSCHHRPVRVAAIPDFFSGDPDVSPPFASLSTGTGGQLFFVVEYGLFAGLPFEAQLWVSNGTGSGTKLLSRSLLGADIPIAPLTPVGDGRIVFSARDPDHGLEPWVSDGTPGGTRLLQDLVPGPVGSGPREFTRSEDFIFFVAHTPETGNELWALPLLPGGQPTAGR
jgi:ELWxxDGT repeat protein